MVVKLVPILGITFIDIVGFSILIPILPFFAQHFGASDVVVGLLFSSFFACQFVSGPVWGHISDRIGRKSVLIVSQIGATIGWAMLGFAHNIATVFAARIVEGVSGGNISITQAYVSDLVEPKQRTRAYAYVSAAFSAGFVFGPALGGTLYHRYGYAAPFLAAAALQLLTLVLTIFMLPESRTKDQDATVASFLEIGRSLANSRVAPLLWQLWAYSLALYAWFGVMALWFKADLHLRPDQAAFIFAGFGVVNTIFQALVTGRVADRLGDRVTSNLGLALAAAAFALVPFVRSSLALIPQFGLFMAGMALARPALTALLTEAAPKNQRGAILGTGSALDNLSGVLMPPVSTGALQRYGAPWAGAPSVVCATIALVMGLAAQRRARKFAMATAEDHAS